MDIFENLDTLGMRIMLISLVVTRKSEVNAVFVAVRSFSFVIFVAVAERR